MSSAVFRPRSVFEIIDAAFQLVRRHPQPFLILGAVTSLPGLVLGILSQGILKRMEAGGEVGMADGLLVLVGGVLWVMWLFVGIGAIVVAASDAYLGEPVDAGRALRRAAQHWTGLAVAPLFLYLLLTLGVVVLAVLGATVTVVLPVALRPVGFVAMLALGFAYSFYITARYSVIHGCITLEGLRLGSALGRSRALTDGAKVRITGLLLVLLLILLGVGFAAYALVLLVVRDETIAGTLINILYVLIYPIAGAAMALLYYDLRIRKEGYDIELMARGLGGAPAEQQRV